jgi:hypothetical protein
MKRTLMSLIASAALVGGAGGAFAKSDSSQQHLSLSDLPTPVQDSIQREAKSKRVEELRKTTDANGNEVYKAEIVSGTRGTDLTIAPDGKIIDRTSHNEAAEHKKGEQ